MRRCNWLQWPNRGNPPQAKPQFHLPLHAVSQIQEVANNAQALLDSQNLRVRSGDILPTLRGKVNFARAKTKEFADRLSSALEDEAPESQGTDITSRLLKAPPRPRLNLDDAVTVLRNISFSTTRETVSYTKAELDQVIQSALMSFQAQAGSSQRSTKPPGRDGGVRKSGKGNDGSKRNGGGRGNGRGGGTKKGKGNGKKGSVQRCGDCGSPHHRTGDSSCNKPSYDTLLRQRDTQLKQSEEQGSKGEDANEDDKDEGVQDFRTGTKPGKRNHR